MKTFTPFLLMPLLLTPLLIANGYAEPGNKSADATLRVGVISVLTGEGAAWGVNHQRGTLLAVEDFNAKNGINGKQIEITTEDSPGGLARNAVTAYNKLVRKDKIKIILGPVMMDELLAIAPLAQKDHVFIGGATYMPNAPKNFFTTWIDADIESALIARTVCTKYDKVAVLSSQQSWEAQVADSFASACAELGGKIVSFQEPSFETHDVKSEVLKVKQRGPEAVFISSYLLLPNYLKALKALGIKPALYGIELDQSVIDNSLGAAEGLIFIAPSAPSATFTDRFRKRWKANPDIPAASAYDAATLLFTAISERGEDVNEIISYFSDFRGYNGAVGRIEKQDGKTVISTSLYQVINGRIEPLDEEDSIPIGGSSPKQ